MISTLPANGAATPQIGLGTWKLHGGHPPRELLQRR